MVHHTSALKSSSCGSQSHSQHGVMTYDKTRLIDQLVKSFCLLHLSTFNLYKIYPTVQWRLGLLSSLSHGSSALERRKPLGERRASWGKTEACNKDSNYIGMGGCTLSEVFVLCVLLVLWNRDIQFGHPYCGGKELKLANLASLRVSCPVKMSGVCPLGALLWYWHALPCIPPEWTSSSRG